MADERTPDDVPEETKERYRTWWLSRTPEERARLRAMNGEPVTPHELVFLTDSAGFPMAADRDDAADRRAVFFLPDFLLHEPRDEARPGVTGEADPTTGGS